jgi:hypothetical protein
VAKAIVSGLTEEVVKLFLVVVVIFLSLWVSV